MTAATTNDVATCRRCGGPCGTYKGSVHGWTCNGCIAAYLEQSAAKADARDRRERQKNARKLLQRNETEPSVTTDRRRDGGGPDVFRTPVPASAPA